MLLGAGAHTDAHAHRVLRAFMNIARVDRHLFHRSDRKRRIFIADRVALGYARGERGVDVFDADGIFDIVLVFCKHAAAVEKEISDRQKRRRQHEKNQNIDDIQSFFLFHESSPPIVTASSSRLSR